eukprot:gene11356-12376_t
MPSLTTIDLNKNDNFIDIEESEDFHTEIEQNNCSSSSNYNNQLKAEDAEELIKVVQSKIDSIRDSMNQLAVYVMDLEDTIFRLRSHMTRVVRQKKSFEDIQNKFQKNFQSLYDESSESNDVYLQVPQIIDETNDLVNHQRVDDICKLNRILSEETILFLNRTYHDLDSAKNHFPRHNDAENSLKALHGQLQDRYNRIEDNQSILQQINSKIQHQQRRQQQLHQSTIKQFSLAMGKIDPLEQRNRFNQFKYQPQDGTSHFEEDETIDYNDFFGDQKSPFQAPSGQLRSDREVNRRHNIEEEESDGEAEWREDDDDSERRRKKPRYITEDQEKSGYFQPEESLRSPDISPANILTHRTRGESRDDMDIKIMSKVTQRKYQSSHDDLVQSPQSVGGDDERDEVETRKQRRKGEDGDDSDWVDADEKPKKKGKSLKTTARKEPVKKPGKSPNPATSSLAPTTRSNDKSVLQVIEIE